MVAQLRLNYALAWVWARPEGELNAKHSELELNDENTSHNVSLPTQQSFDFQHSTPGTCTKMLLEDQRYIHEDLERLEQGIADRMGEEPKHVSLGPDVFTHLQQNAYA